MKREKTSFRDRAIIILVYVSIAVLIAGCNVKKKVYEKVIERDSIAYVLPSSNTLVIKELCDTLGVPVFVNSTVYNGIAKVNLKVDKKTNTLTLETENDTIYKEKIVYRDRVKTEEVIKYKTDFKLLFFIAAIGFLIGFFKPWKIFLK